jgi:predicted nucleotide-binding protein
MDKRELLTSLRKDVLNLQPLNDVELDRLIQRAVMIVKNIYGRDSGYLTRIRTNDFHLDYYTGDIGEDLKQWKLAQGRLINTIDTLLEESDLFDIQVTAQNAGAKNGVLSNEVFVVHGHDENMKQTVARALGKLDLSPIILHEKPNQGKTIIEKFQEFANVSFAIVLISGDDMGYSAKADPTSARPRARQNVILELGYFLGLLGRDRVVVLFREAENLEMPSDYDGVVFVPFDQGGGWQVDLLKELKAVGFAVDANKLL